MSLTVLYPVFNAGQKVVDSLNLILEISCLDQVLIADGGSDDQTLELINSINSEKVKIVSFQDDGIYNGINNVLPSVKSKYVVWINSDDYINPKYYEAGVNLLDRCSTLDFIYGSVHYGDVSLLPRYRTWKWFLLKYIFMPFPHVTFITRSSLFLSIGSFDESFRISGDLDFLIRFLKVFKNGYNLNLIAATCDRGGLSDGVSRSKEVYRIIDKFEKNRFRGFLKKCIFKFLVK